MTIERARMAIEEYQSCKTVDQAQAALEAIAEPTQEMMRAGAAAVLSREDAEEQRTVGISADECIAIKIWRAMHRAMLKEKETKE